MCLRCKLLIVTCFREGRSNAHIKGDYQRIGDVMLKNLQGLKVRYNLLYKTQLCFDTRVCHFTNVAWSTASDSKPTQAV